MRRENLQSIGLKIVYGRKVGKVYDCVLYTIDLYVKF